MREEEVDGEMIGNEAIGVSAREGLLFLPFVLRRRIFAIDPAFGEKGDDTYDGKKQQKYDKDSDCEGITFFEVIEPSREDLPASEEN